MTAVLPSASTRVIRTGTAVATGIDLATIWGCCPLNADMVPRLQYDGAALEAFHGPGQLLDQASLLIRITGLPVLVVPLPINTQGVIRDQRQAGTGTAAATVAAGSDGSLERVDGILRVAQQGGGTVGVDQIRLEYSLDGGNGWSAFRLGTGTTYAIPRIGQTITLAGGTLIAGEEILYWTSTAPTPADADIATARENLAAQGLQSRAWYLIRELEKEQDLSAYQTAVETYDTTDKRPLQAYAAIRRPYDRNGKKAQLSRVRSWMQGSPSITFTQGAGPPNDTISRDAGSFIADGFGDWSLGNGDWITVAGSSQAGNNGSWKLSAADTLILTTDTAGAFTTVTDASGVTIWAAPGLEFVDGGGGDDTLVRGRGSWLDEGFEIGDTITVAGTSSNDGTYTITDLSADTITVATGSFSAEEISSWDVQVYVAGALYPIDVAAMDAAFGIVTNQYKLELSYGHLWNSSPATGRRLRYPVALADMCRTFIRDLSETTWEEGGGDSLAGAEGWGMVDLNGQPFEYDERRYRAALAAEFTCARTHEENPETVPYIARSLTRYGGGTALTQSEKARVTNLARRIVQLRTKALTGAVFVKSRPDALGRQFLTAGALSKIEDSVNGELGRQLLGNTRRGRGPRVSSVIWRAARDDDFAVQNPVLHGVLTVDTLAPIVTVTTDVEVL